MKTLKWLTGMACAILALATEQTRAQGSLTPPGPPAPAMKTLTQIEPRTPISSLPFTINSPGSYYLTTNLSTIGDGLSISASDVTVDFSGFTLNSYIFGSDSTNVLIRNGTILNQNYAVQLGNDCRVESIVFRNCNGVALFGRNRTLVIKCHFIACDGVVWIGDNGKVSDCRFAGNANCGLLVGENCEVSDCVIQHANRATFSNGIESGARCIIKNCVVQGNIQYSGIYVGAGSIVDGCAVSDILGGGSGIKTLESCLIKDCTVNGNNLDGIEAGSGSTVTHCSVKNNGRHGISVADASTVEGCTLRGNGADGILATYSAFIRDNVCDVNASNGVHIINFNSRVDNNNLTGNYTGVKVDTGGNVIIRNTARGNWGLGNYSIAGGNDTGPIGQAATATSPWANISY